MKKIHIDMETFSTCDLKEVGAYRYAAECEILCAAMALDDEEPVVWSLDREPMTGKLLQCMAALEDPSVLVYAHNAAFEMAVLQNQIEETWGIPCPDLSRFRCTASLARRASLPAKLETLALTLGLTNLKDNKGKNLIRKFSVMQSPKKPTKKNPEGLPARRIRPEDEPEAFAEFCEYCRQDVRVEQEVAKRLAYFDSEPNNSNYSLDAIINARGVPVNLSALRHAQVLIDEETEIVSAKFRELTGFEVTQNAVFLKWLNDGGCNLSDLQAESIETYLDENYFPEVFVPRAIAALKLKASISYASIKKVKTMLACAGPRDSRMRGLLIHHGCSTGRWSASLVQPQNLKRSTKGSEDAYRMICNGESREMLEICHGSVLETISTAIRHFFQDYPNNIFSGDYSGVEARVVCWLSGQEDALERFRAYDRATPDEKKSLDPYRLMASDVYKIPVKEVTPFPHRFVGKTLVLGAGFMLSPGGFRRNCLKLAKYDLPVGQEHTAIGLWRRKHQKVVQWWKDLDNAGKRAVVNPGKVFTAGKISFCSKRIEGILFLLMKLPSGRELAYPHPKIVSGKFEGTTQIQFWGNIKGTKWGDCRLWPGLAANNATQGTANDLMFEGVRNCERENYQIFNVIHDEALSYIQPGQTSERFLKLLTAMPDWANGLPLASEGGEAPFYRKS